MSINRNKKQKNMIKKTHKLSDVRFGENDAIVDVITHDGVKIFHCALHTKHLFEGGNHLLANNILNLCRIIKETIGTEHIRFYIFDDKLGVLFNKAMKLSDKCELMSLEESIDRFTLKAFEKWGKEMEEISILSSLFLKQDKGKFTSTELGLYLPPTASPFKQVAASLDMGYQHIVVVDENATEEETEAFIIERQKSKAELLLLIDSRL